MTINLCVTELIKNPEPYQPNFGARKWTEVVALDCFARVREVAETVYENMESRSHYVPEITRHGVDGITMSWYEDEDRIVTIILEPSKFSYRWGRQGVKLPTYTIDQADDAKKAEMLELFSSYLNRKIEVNHDTVGGDSISVGSGPRREEDGGKMGSDQCDRPRRNRDRRV